MKFETERAKPRDGWERARTLHKLYSTCSLRACPHSSSPPTPTPNSRPQDLHGALNNVSHGQIFEVAFLLTLYLFSVPSASVSIIIITSKGWRKCWLSVNLLCVLDVVGLDWIYSKSKSRRLSSRSASRTRRRGRSASLLLSLPARYVLFTQMIKSLFFLPPSKWCIRFFRRMARLCQSCLQLTIFRDWSVFAPFISACIFNTD